ncbi:MAG: alanine--glyoxylate aminotransferase family protein [Candidatus Latescibacterota bacterium]
MKRRLFTPGPTTVPDQLRLKMAEPIIHHRSQEFGRMFASVNEGLKYLFQTENDVLTLTSSGTGAMEAAVVNLLCAGDRALVVRGGKFGERWGELCETYGVHVTAIDVPWGQAVPPETISEHLKADPTIKAVFATQSETSTGALNDIEAIGRVVRETEALLVVDAITGIGAHPMLPDAWGVDVVVTGSQKGLMLPPGLAFIALNERAWAAVKRSDLPKYYLDLTKAKKSLSKNQNPYTPAVSIIVGLKAALDMISEEGIENVWARHARNAEATRAAVRAMGLGIFAKNPSNVLTIVQLPDQIDGKQLVKVLDGYGLTVAGGQEQLSGRVIRISHLGYTDDFDSLSVIAGLERALRDMGWDLEPGVGLSAAQAVLAG